MGSSTAQHIAVGVVLALLQCTVCWHARAYSAITCGNEPVRIEIWYGDAQHFGRHGQPQRWINILGSIRPAELVDSAFFRVNGGEKQPLSLGSDLHRLAFPGDFNAEIGWDVVRDGLNKVTIGAIDRTGRLLAEAMVEVQVEKGNTWPLPYSIDFSKTGDLQRAVQVVDGHWELTGNGVRTVQRWYDRVVCMGDTTWRDYEAVIRLTIHDYSPPAPGPPTYNVTHMGVALRWRGHHLDGRQPSRKWYPLGAQGEFLVKENLDSCRWRILFDGGNADKPPAYSQTINSIAPERCIVLKAQVATAADGRTRYRFKQWLDGEMEPDHWDVVGFEKDDYPSGALCLVPHNTDVTIHEVHVVALPAVLRD